MPLNREGLKITYRPLNADVCRYILEALAEGIVLANMVELERGCPDMCSLTNEGVTYEPPQQDCAQDQEVGTLSEVLHKGRATCLEAAAIEAAVERRAGYDAVVEIEFELDEYDRPIPWRYHAYVRHQDGSLSDPSAALKGTPKVGHHDHDHEHGACCASCAVGKPCESDCPSDDPVPVPAAGGHRHLTMMRRRR